MTDGDQDQQRPRSIMVIGQDILESIGRRGGEAHIFKRKVGWAEKQKFRWIKSAFQSSNFLDYPRMSTCHLFSYDSIQFPAAINNFMSNNFNSDVEIYYVVMFAFRLSEN